MQQPNYAQFYSFSEAEQIILDAAAEYPDLMRVESLAVTAEGRHFYLITLSDFSDGVDPRDKGAFYLQAGIHAEEGAGVTGALDFLYRLLTENRALLRDITVYIAPMVNPDGMDYAVTKSAVLRSAARRLPDAPNALIPADLNGDGKILTMRWQDPLGNMKPLPGYPDILIPREPGDREGVFYSTCTEGRLERWEGGPPVPGMRMLDFNRHYPLNWRDSDVGGDYPGRSLEPRTITEFLSSHPNIYAAADLHCGTAGFLYNTPANFEDSELILKMGRLGEQMTGLPMIAGQDYRFKRSPVNVLYGSLRDFSYDALGISFYTIELGNGFNSMGLSSREIFSRDVLSPVADADMMRQLAEFHAAQKSLICYPWEAYDHPQLGPVEIGGMKHGQAYYMYPAAMAELLPKLSGFLQLYAAMRPELRFGNTACDAVAPGVYRIRAELMNVGEVGTQVMQGSVGYQARRDVQIYVQGGGEILSRPVTHILPQLKALEKARLEWFIRGEPGQTVTLRAIHPKSGVSTLDIRLP